jgi:uncharacterized alpha/beta hydrolase family protein
LWGCLLLKDALVICRLANYIFYNTTYQGEGMDTGIVITLGVIGAMFTAAATIFVSLLKEKTLRYKSELSKLKKDMRDKDRQVNYLYCGWKMTRKNLGSICLMIELLDSQRKDGSIGWDDLEHRKLFVEESKKLEKEIDYYIVEFGGKE